MAQCTGASQGRQSTRRRGKLSAALLRPELAAEDLDISRDRDTGRDVAL